MKLLIFTTATILTLASCKKDKIYNSFSSKELHFVSYTEGQSLKFIDTNLITYSLTQNVFLREFDEQIGLYGRTGFFSENYEVSYSSNGSTLAFGFNISLSTRSIPSLHINFCDYGLYAAPDSILTTINSIVINGITYKNVYTIKGYKNEQYLNNNDTAILYHNKQYGIIQLLFPNGKRIVRTE